MLLLLYLFKCKVRLIKPKNFLKSMRILNQKEHKETNVIKSAMIQILQTRINIQEMKLIKNVKKIRRKKEIIHVLILTMIKRKLLLRKLLKKLLKLRQNSLGINMSVHSHQHLISPQNSNATELKILRDIMEENLSWKLKNVQLKLIIRILTSMLFNNAELYLSKYGHIRKIVMEKKSQMILYLKI